MTTPLENFEARWTEAVPYVPLHNPSNLEIDLNDMPDPWAGVLVQAETLSHATLGSDPWKEERGRFVVGVFTRAGTGFDRNDSRVRSIMEAFYEWSTSDRRFCITSIEGPFDIEPEADGGWFRLGLEIHYQMWER